MANIADRNPGDERMHWLIYTSTGDRQQADKYVRDSILNKMEARMDNA